MLSAPPEPDVPKVVRPAAEVSGPFRERFKQVVSLALPIIGGMVSQNVLNLVDTLMVGGLGKTALAAVGLGGFTNFMSVALVTGLSAGVQAMAARRHGEGRTALMAAPLNGALILAVVTGIPMTGLILLLIPHLFPLLSPDPAVVATGSAYLMARVIALPAVGINFSFRGYWNGINRPGLYMRALIVTHVSNIGLNAVFIYGLFGAPALGAVGAGVASAIAPFIAVAYYFYLGEKYAREHGFLRARPDTETIRTMLRLALPNGIQQTLFAGGFTMMFWILGQIGTAETAAANVLINLMLVAILPGIALGMAAMSLVGQALGRADVAAAHRWGWDVVRVAWVVAAVLGLPLLAVPDLILGLFLHEHALVELARPALRVFAATLVIDLTGLVLQHAMLGAGANRTSMFVTVIAQWGIFLPLAYWVGPVLGYGLLGVWVVQAAYRAIQAGVFAWLWQHGTWAHVKL
jgi:putative MATE family efflux protein